MAKKKKTKAAKPKGKLHLLGGAAPNVTFPGAGSQDCFSQGTPFIAYGGLAGAAVMAGAAVILPGRTVNGVRLTDAELAQEINGEGNPTGKLAGYPDHDWINPQPAWAYAFPDFDNTGGAADLPVDAPAAFVATSADVSGAQQTIVPFQHHVGP